MQGELDTIREQLASLQGSATDGLKGQMDSLKDELAQMRSQVSEQMSEFKSGANLKELNAKVEMLSKKLN